MYIDSDICWTPMSLSLYAINEGSTSLALSHGPTLHLINAERLFPSKVQWNGKVYPLNLKKLISYS